MSGRRLLSPLEVSQRSLADMRVAASQSFTPEEVHALAELLAIVRRGGDVSVMRRAPGFLSLERKASKMRDTIERQRERRKLVGRPDLALVVAESTAAIGRRIDEEILDLPDPPEGLAWDW